MWWGRWCQEKKDLLLELGECWQQGALCSAVSLTRQLPPAEESHLAQGHPHDLQVTADLCEGVKVCPPRLSSGQPEASSGFRIFPAGVPVALSAAASGSVSPSAQPPPPFPASFSPSFPSRC